METEEDDIRKRLQWASRYHYMKAFGAKVYTFDCKEKQDAKELESSVLHRFYEKYRVLSVGNPYLFVQSYEKYLFQPNG